MKAPGGTVVLPLLITAVEANFSGDRTTTNQGATLTVAPNGTQHLTINNPAWKVTNAPIGASATGVSVFSGPYPASLDLDFTTFGGWYGLNTINSVSYYTGGGQWVGGLETPVGAMPVSGSASYAGNVNGQYSLYSKCTCADFGIVSGNVGMTANFGTRSVTGKMTNLLVVDGTGFNDPLNDILFSASIGSGSNKFVGTTSVSGPPRAPSGVGTPSGLVGLGLNATGTVVGGFFGPTAQEAGAIWTIDDGAARVIGSFGAKLGN
ncbi:MAG: transferrin-binding protein-like solute binding protein [Sphingomicrobium sp.]